MIAPSSVSQVARADSNRNRDELMRYARLEYGSPATAWMLPENHSGASRGTGFVARIAARFHASSERRAALRETLARPFRAGPAGVHLTGDAPLSHGGASFRAEATPQAILFPAPHAHRDEDHCECPF